MFHKIREKGKVKNTLLKTLNKKVTKNKSSKNKSSKNKSSKNKSIKNKSSKIKRTKKYRFNIGGMESNSQEDDENAKLDKENKASEADIKEQMITIYLDTLNDMITHKINISRGDSILESIRRQVEHLPIRYDVYFGEDVIYEEDTVDDHYIEDGARLVIGLPETVKIYIDNDEYQINDPNIGELTHDYLAQLVEKDDVHFEITLDQMAEHYPDLDLRVTAAENEMIAASNAAIVRIIYPNIQNNLRINTRNFGHQALDVVNGYMPSVMGGLGSRLRRSNALSGESYEGLTPNHCIIGNRGEEDDEED